MEDVDVEDVDDVEDVATTGGGLQTQVVVELVDVLDVEPPLVVDVLVDVLDVDVVAPQPVSLVHVFVDADQTILHIVAGQLALCVVEVDVEVDVEVVP